MPKKKTPDPFRGFFVGSLSVESEKLSAAFASVSDAFKAKALELALQLECAGTTECMRIADRLLQNLRKAKRIKFRDGYWHKQKGRSK